MLVSMSRKRPSPPPGLPHRASEREQIPAHLPRKSRNRGEIRHRHTLWTGTLVLEEQLAGTKITGRVLEHLAANDPGAISESTNFAAMVLAATMYRTAIYNGYQQDPAKLTERLTLPRLHGSGRHATTSRVLLDRSIRAVNTCVKPADSVVRAIHRLRSHVPLPEDTPRVPSSPQDYEKLNRLAERKLALAERLGNTALILGCVPIGNQVTRNRLTDEQAAATAAQQFYAIQSNIDELTKYLGQPPSLAQLSDTSSSLSRYWHDWAPDAAYEAYATVIENPL